MDGRLEVRLFSVNHHSHILLLRILEDLVQAVNLICTRFKYRVAFSRLGTIEEFFDVVYHVAELHLLVLGQ